MKEYGVCKIQWRLEWSTANGKAVLTGKVAERARELIREVCPRNGAGIISGHIAKSGVCITVTLPPVLSVAALARYLKGATSRRLGQEFPALLCNPLWARGYLAT
jgi:putative transposase